MKTFKAFNEDLINKLVFESQDYISEEFIPSHQEEMNEVLMTFGGKAYPKSGNVVLMSGGAAAGKGFVLKNLIGLEGKVFDVDALKSMSMNLIGFDKTLQAIYDDLYKKGKIKEKYNAKEVLKDEKALKNPDHVLALHLAIKQKEFDSKIKDAFYSQVINASPEKKPNIIFDVTMQSLSKLVSIGADLDLLGYDKKNIHIVWVVNKFEVAQKQNQKRDRVVPEDIMFITHSGAATSMAQIITGAVDVRKYADGDIYIAFNQAVVDSEILKGNNKNIVVKKADYIKIKSAGHPVDNSALTLDVVRKIQNYVPKGTFNI